MSGYLTGKKGDAVFVVREGCQIVRQYTALVKDAKSAKQTAVRAKTKLITQLSSVYAPILAFPKVKLTSKAMQFVKHNYGRCQFDGTTASVDFPALQITNGFRFMPNFTVDRTSKQSIECSLYEDAHSFLTGVMYVVISVDSEGSIRVESSQLQTVAGADGLFTAQLPYVDSAVCVYAYGLYNSDITADHVQYANIKGRAAEYVAELTALRSTLMRNTYFSFTKGAFLEANEDSGNSEYVARVRVTVNAPAGLHATGGGLYEVGEVVTLSVNPDVDWTFHGWFINNALVSSETVYQFNPEGNVTVEARGTYEADSVVTVVSNNNSFGSVTGGGTYPAGGSATLRAVPAAGYRFVGWYSGWTDDPSTATLLSSDNPYTYYPNGDITITGVFEVIPIVTHTLNLLQSNQSDGTATQVTGAGSYAEGATANINCVYDSNNYRFIGWFNNANETNPANAFSTQAQTSVTMSADKNLYYLLEAIPNTVQISVSQSTQGGATVTGAGEVQRGSSVTLSATPNGSNQIYGWLKNGFLVATGNSYTFTAEDNTLIVLLVDVAGKTMVAPRCVGDPDAILEGAGVYSSAENVTLTVQPSPGHNTVTFVSALGGYSNQQNGSTATAYVMAGVSHVIMSSSSSDTEYSVVAYTTTQGANPMRLETQVTKGQPASIDIQNPSGYEMDSVRVLYAGTTSQVNLTKGHPVTFTPTENCVVYYYFVEPEE